MKLKDNEKLVVEYDIEFPELSKEKKESIIREYGLTKYNELMKQRKEREDKFNKFDKNGRMEFKNNSFMPGTANTMIVKNFRCKKEIIEGNNE